MTVCSASGSERSSITVSSSKEGNPLLIALSERRLIALDRPIEKHIAQVTLSHIKFKIS